MATTATQICNLALSLLGDKRIQSFGETDTKEGRLTNLYYEQVRDEVIGQSGVEFKSATERAGPLSAATGEPLFGWDYAYPIPESPKCLRVIGLVSDESDQILDIDWKREGDFILTNEEEVYILYVKRVTDPSLFPSQLIHAIYLKLAAEMSFSLTADKRMRANLLEEYSLIVLPEAVMTNNAEGSVEGEAGEFSWTNTGRS